MTLFKLRMVLDAYTGRLRRGVKAQATLYGLAHETIALSEATARVKEASER